MPETTRESFRVKIISCHRPMAWYRYLIGCYFDVYQLWCSDYVLKYDYDQGGDAVWRHISIEDAERVQND
jgi:hypothetical protein